ncbi:MAG TPA: ribonuclease P protein component [Acidimicrobiia bacterium]|nr:ribonuclease P protein component [Acidimicrobiia bacterium]
MPLSKHDDSKAGSVSLPDIEPLRSPRDFRRVLREGTRRRSGGVVMVQCPGRTGPARVGLVVSKSAGDAVTRNRIKRRLRHITRTLPLKPGIDYVIIGASQVADVSHPNLVGWLRRALEETHDG